ncbi:uncharacterized protein FOMMEDRAFT_150168 [Fomitiporia mediterranea MF3/22]|uniref:uncharacterized protein n=1 Tax=Fomitiporia mediterranea (strain MF3/22) TaxID=694068 RepID=UPI00044098C8|nr:uncharacterized protein FOMMEDRAFT_150168 [Fomitiporia mediterranea MF3/22]EJD07628.1 hypothetical protein FOMMEDRAFT_150168 [Fomitiporia mediterranea MF3/22]
MTITALPSPDDVKTPKNYKEHFKTRKTVVTKFVDPCEEASRASMECLNRGNYDKRKCKAFFDAYNDCKKAWIERRREDGLRGRDNKIDIKT